MPSPRHCLLALGLSAVAASAQSTHVLPLGLATAAGNSSNSFPWGTSASGFAGLRVMACYDSSNFTAAGINAPIRITRLRWRANDSASSWTGGTFAQGTVAMATATVDHAAIGTAFAQNVGADAHTVYSGPVTYLPGAGTGIGRSGPVVVDLPLTTPFRYDPAAGDLVIDVDYPGGTNFSGGSLSAMDVQTGAAASRAYASTAYPVGSGTTVGHGIVVEFDWTPANGLFAEFQASVHGGPSPLAVQFTDRSWSSAAGGITTWAWDFDQDGLTDSTLANPLHTFATCGRHTVSLRVTDGVHAPATTVQVDCVVTDAITPDFTWHIIGPNALQFVDTSTPPATARAWDLDGDHVVDANGPTAVWVYGATTTPIAVSLTASRLCGTPATVTRQVLPGPHLLTTLAGGNGLTGSAAGNVFDLQVTNPNGINLTSLTMCPLSTTTPIGAPIRCDVWLCATAGGVAEHHDDPSVWRLVASAQGTFQGGATTITSVPTDMLLDHRVFLAPGDYAMALHLHGCGIAYTSGAVGSAPSYGNADLRITCGLAKPQPFSPTSTSPRIWNGVLHYDLCTLGVTSGYGYLAPGCATAAGAVPGQRLVALPTMGQSFAVVFDALPHDLAFATVGWSNTLSPVGPLPLDLTPFGAPGCRLHTSLDVTQVLFGSNGQAQWSTFVPVDPALLWLRFYTQALAFDPAANAAGWVAGDAGAGVVGN